MTDLEKFLALYKEFGITLNVGRPGDKDSEFSWALTNRDRWLVLDEEEWATVRTVVTLGNPYCLKAVSLKFQGYSGFFSQVLFDESGKFLYQGFWE